VTPRRLPLSTQPLSPPAKIRSDIVGLPLICERAHWLFHSSL